MILVKYHTICIIASVALGRRRTHRLNRFKCLLDLFEIIGGRKVPALTKIKCFHWDGHTSAFSVDYIILFPENITSI